VQGLGSAGLDISQGTEANGCGALPDWPCALKNSFHIFHLQRPCPAEMALKMGAIQFSYVKPYEWLAEALDVHIQLVGNHL
jgi:hypothetical protein